MKIVEKIKRSPKVSSLLIFAILLVVIGTYNIKPNNLSVAETGSSTYCGNAYMYSEPSDIAVAHVYVDTTQPSTPKKVEVYRGSTKIGQAKPEGGSFDWFMKIPIRLLDPEPKSVFAKIYFEDGHSCQTVAQQDGIGSVNYNTEPVNMDIIPSKQSVVLPTNNSTTISARIQLHPAIEPNGDFFTDYAIYEWSVQERGTITSRFSRNTSFFSGPSAGQGKLKVRVQFGKLQSEYIIPTSVESASSPIKDNSTTSSSTDNSATSTSSLDSIEAEKEEIKQTSALESSDPKVSCAESAIGEASFKEINEGKRRPTTQELDKLRNCFAESRYVIPSNFAPVSPANVKDLQTSNKTKLNSVNGSIKRLNEEEKQTLVLSGTAEPNSTVVLYVFSEPIVLTTTTNNNGEWTYELEDPLEPGEHEVYAVVDRGDGVYEKSDPFSFVVANAEATAENPAGLSLTLNEQESATESNSNIFLYSLSSALLLLTIVVVAYLAYRKGKSSPAANVKISTNPDAELNNGVGAIISQTIEPSDNQDGAQATSSNSEATTTQDVVDSEVSHSITNSTDTQVKPQESNGRPAVNEQSSANQDEQK